MTSYSHFDLIMYTYFHLTFDSHDFDSYVYRTYFVIKLLVHDKPVVT